MSGRDLVRQGLLTVDDVATLGVDPGIARCTAFGVNPSIGSDAEDIWTRGGDMVFPTSADHLDVSSTSSEDAPGGTGADTVRVWGLQDGFTLGKSLHEWIEDGSEDLTLDGTTSVQTTNEYIRLLRAVVIGGSDADGAISFTHPEGELSRIESSLVDIVANRTADASFTIPDGFVGLLKTLFLAPEAREDSVVALMSRSQGAPVFNTSAQLDFRQAIVQPDLHLGPLRAGTDFKVRGHLLGGSSNRRLQAGFTIKLVSKAALGL